MNEQDCVIYKGNFFQIEWYYSEKGESQPYAYMKKGDKLPKSEKQLAINCKTDYLSRFQNDQEEKK